MFLDTVQTIWNVIQELVSTMLTVDRIFYIGVGFVLLMIVFFFIKSSLSYEVKLARTIDRLNNWLGRNRNITASNLIEFNSLIKDRRSPKVLRKHWQQFMLYRDKLPSEYMSAYNCIDRPSKTSSFSANIKNFSFIVIMDAIITFFLGLIYYAGKADTVVASISLSLLAPVTILFIGVVAIIVLRLMQNYNLASLYQTFHLFSRGIDNASATIPKYVDFEVLFTQKEIKEGIPVLGEYLEKRARQEQEELEEAQKNAVSHEEYDFASSGVDGSLMLERAMKESETYINAKQRLLSEIQQFESEITTLGRNYENTSKDFQRKLQASKENMERLRQQQEESTNRIEVNYIRKQQQDEVRKQEQLEKDLDDTTNKYNVEVNSLNQEIEKRRAQIEERKARVQDAMDSEYQSFASKLHENIQAEIQKASEDDIQKLSVEKDQYAQAIAYLKNETDNKDEIIKAKDQTIEELQKRIESLDAALINAQSGAGAAGTSQDSDDEDGTYDDKGYYWFKDGTYYDNLGKYHDLEGNVYSEDGDLIAEGQQVETQQAIDINQQTTQGLNADGQEENEISEIEKSVNSAIEEQRASEQATAAHYDDKGYYWYEDKTYYDNNGLFHDLNGNVYDSAGNLVAENQVVETESTIAQAETNNEQSSSGHYDDKGYYWYEDNTYYDNNGQFHDLQGNVYDSAGNLILTNQEVEAPTGSNDVNSVQEAEIAEDEQVPVEEKPEKKKAGRPRKERTEEQEQPKKKVGRPRKERPADEAEKPKRGVGRPRKEEVKEQAEQPKKKVGRPRKERPADEIEKPKRGVGRPRKERTEEQEQPKKKVGRPRKERPADEVEKPKRGVGRPRKEEVKEQAEQPKKKAGRPKKEKLANEAEKPKRGVGRPKGTTNSHKRKLSRQ